MIPSLQQVKQDFEEIFGGRKPDPVPADLPLLTPEQLAEGALTEDLR